MGEGESNVLLVLQKRKKGGFPGGAVVGSLPADAGDMGSGPGLGGSHMPRSGTITEPVRLEPVLRSKRGRGGGRPAHRDEEWPRLPRLEKALAQKRGPNTAINN